MTIYDIIYEILFALSGFLLLKWLHNIYAGDDKKLNREELNRFVSFLFFLWASIYIIIKEANRPAGTEHIFSEIWIFFIISGLLTVLSLDRIFDTMTKLIDSIAKLRKPPKNETE